MKFRKIKSHKLSITALAAVIVLGVFFGVPQVQNYFKLSLSHAAEFDVDLEQITDWLLGGEALDFHNNLILLGNKVDFTGGYYPYVYKSGEQDSLEKIVTESWVISPRLYSDAQEGDFMVYKDSSSSIKYCNIYDCSDTMQKIPHNSIDSQGRAWLKDSDPDIYKGKIAFVREHANSETVSSAIYLLDMHNPMNGAVKISSEIATSLDDEWRRQNKFNLKFDNNKIVWEDWRNNTATQSNPMEYQNTDIYLIDLEESSPEEVQITTDNKNQSNPDVMGDVVVWEDYRNGGADIYKYIYSTGQESSVVVNSGDQRNPVAHGSYVVYEYHQLFGSNVEIYISKLDGSYNALLPTGSTQCRMPIIYSNQVAFSKFSATGPNGNIISNVFLLTFNFDVPYLISPADGTKFDFNNLAFQWAPATGTNPSQYWISTKLDGVLRPEIPVGLVTFLSLPSDSIETNLKDGAWEWGVKAQVGNDISQSSYWNITKKTGADLIAPPNNSIIQSGTKFDWETIDNSKNYIIQIKGGKITGFPTDCTSNYCYIPLNNGGGDKSELILNDNLFKRLQQLKIYTWSVAGTSLKNIDDGSYNLKSDDPRLPKLSYSKVGWFFKKSF